MQGFGHCRLRDTSRLRSRVEADKNTKFCVGYVPRYPSLQVGKYAAYKKDPNCQHTTVSARFGKAVVLSSFLHLGPQIRSRALQTQTTKNQPE